MTLGKNNVTLLNDHGYVEFIVIRRYIMAKLTPYGKEIRHYRLDNQLSLRDMADKLEISAAFLSGVETGRKPISENLINKVLTYFEFTSEQKESLMQAVYKTVKEFKIKPKNESRRDIAEALARKIDELDEDEINKLRAILK